MVEDLKAFGYPPAEIEKARADFNAMPIAPADFAVHPDNIFAVKLFRAMQTQWDYGSLSTLSTAQIRPLNLKYQVLETVARLEGLGEVSTDDFRRTRWMEVEALYAWAEARK